MAEKIKGLGRLLNWGNIATAVIVALMTLLIGSARDFYAMPRQLEKQEILKEIREASDTCYVRKDVYTSDQKGVIARLDTMNGTLRIILNRVKGY